MAKRICIFLVCLLLVVGIGGCGKSEDKKSETAAKATAKPTEKPTAKPTEKPTPKPTEKPIEKVEATVVDIIDGDTLKVKIGEKTETIRLIGVDAPEGNECFAKEATEHAKKFLLNQPVEVGKDEGLDRDKQGNLLRYIFFQKGEMLFNEIAIEFGYAVEYSDKTPYTYEAAFKKAQERAKEKPQGLWRPDTCDGKVPSAQSRTLTAPSTPKPAESKYSCEPKKTCTQMASCEEAFFHLSRCGSATLDRDKNGVPCESLCKDEISKFSCETKKTCTKMASCTEAYYHLLACGNGQLDQDKNGIPCESICSGK